MVREVVESENPWKPARLVYTAANKRPCLRQMGNET